MAPLKAVMFALEELNARENPDHFADLIEAASRLEMPGGTLARVVANHFDFDDRVMRDWAKGAATPTPRVRHEAVAVVREQLKLCRMG